MGPYLELLRGPDMGIRTALDALFTKELLDAHPDEWGIADHCPRPSSLGYATTITHDTIRKAVEHQVDFVVTHHDAWDFMLEQRQEVARALEQHCITHVWVHLPLDLASFGTGATLLREAGCEAVTRAEEGELWVGELGTATDVTSACSSLTRILDEAPRYVHDVGRTVHRMACVTGAGTLTSHVQQAVAAAADLYVTGETNLYLLEYARYRGLSVAVYSHNYTELPGVEALARMLSDSFGLDLWGHLGDMHC